MILKRNPKRKHQVVLLLLQIPIESTLFFCSLPPSLFPRKFCCLLTISLFYLSYYLLHLHLLHECSHLRSINQSVNPLNAFVPNTHTHTHIVLNNQQPTNQPNKYQISTL